MIKQPKKCKDCKYCDREYDWCHYPNKEGVVLPDKKPPKRCPRLKINL